MESQENLIKTEGSGVATITVMVTRMRIVTSRWKSQRSSRMAGRNGVAIIAVMVIRTRNFTGRKVAVNARKVLLLMVSIIKT